jgi:glycine dehydrogenase subunit 1
VRQLADQRILAGVSLGRLYPEEQPLAHGLLVAVTETSTDGELEEFATALEGALS